MHKRFGKLQKNLSVFLSLVLLLSFLPGMPQGVKAEAGGVLPQRATDTDVKILSARVATPSDFRLVFRDNGSGWNLRRSDNSAEYPGKGTFWEIKDGSTLVLKDGFNFYAEDHYPALLVSDGGNLSVADNATVELACEDEGTTQAISFSGAATLAVGENAYLKATASAKKVGQQADATAIAGHHGLTIDAGVGSKIEAVGHSNGNDHSSATGISALELFEINLADSAELLATVSVASVEYCEALYAAFGDMNIHLGDNAKLTIDATVSPYYNAACKGIMSYENISISGTGSVEVATHGAAARGIQANKNITLSDSVNVVVDSDGIVGAYAHKGSVILQDKAVLLAKGGQAAVSTESKPVVGGTIAASTQKDPSTPPTAQLYTVVDDGNSGITFEDSGIEGLLIFKINSVPAKYLRLAASLTDDFYLQFEQSGGVWKLMKYRSDLVLPIGEYTEQGGYSINQNGTLTFTDNFMFQSADMYGLVLADGATLRVADGKTVSLSTVGASTSPVALSVGSNGTLDIGDSALLDIQASTDEDTGICGISAVETGVLTIQGSGRVQATAAAENAAAGAAGLLVSNGSLVMDDSVTVIAEGTHVGAGVDTVNGITLNDTATLIGKGEQGVRFSAKPTAVNSIAASAERNPNPEPSLRDYGIVDNSDLAFETTSQTFTVNRVIATYTKLSAQAVAPIITTDSLQGGSTDAPYTQMLTATGTATITWSQDGGDLPSGLSLNATTGEISGTPTTAGDYTFTIKATNGVGADIKQFTISITKTIVPPVIMTTNLYGGVAGAPYIQMLTSSGTAPITWSVVDGSLPAGLSLSASSGLIFGTPLNVETAVVTIRASNSAGNDTKQFVISITAAPTAPVITTTDVHGGVVGTPYNQKLAAQGTAPITWAVVFGALPKGLLLNEATGAISGTPTEQGTKTFTVMASNLMGADGQQFAITIDSAPVAPAITTKALQDATVGQYYAQTLSATGTAPITWSVSGTLPNGLQLNSHTGILSGTATKAGTFPLTIKAENSAGQATISLTIRVTQAAVKPTITTEYLYGGVVDEPYNQTLQATGTAPMTWEIAAGNLPDGLDLNVATGAISGTPTMAESQTITITAANAAGTDSKRFTISIVADAISPVITTENLANGKVGAAYHQTLRATGTEPIRWAVVDGTLPKGLSLNWTTGVISGTPVATGNVSLEVQAMNPGGSDTKSFTITISANGGGGGGGGGGSLMNRVPADMEIPDGDAIIVVDDKEYDAGHMTVNEAEHLTTIVIDQDEFAEKIEDARAYVEVYLPAETENISAQLTVGNIEAMQARDITFAIGTNESAYQFHASAMDTAAIMAALGAEDSASVPITFTIQTLLSDAEKAMATSAVQANSGTLVRPPVKFAVTASYGGKSVAVTSFLKYVTWVLEVTEEVQRITTAVVVESANTVRHVPTMFYPREGKWYVAVKSMENATYALIYSDRTFADAQGKWYEDTVNEMASRKIVEGVSENSFAGDRSITRAEFAAIIVRALGLPVQGSTVFSDVDASSWYYGAVGTAHRYGIVSGLPDGTFAPNANITRQEAMVMVRNAAKIAEYGGGTGSLNSFADGAKVASWAEDAARFNVGHGLVVGSNGVLRPTDDISRAETAAIVLRLLRNSELVDVRG